MEKYGVAQRFNRKVAWGINRKERKEYLSVLKIKNIKLFHRETWRNMELRGKLTVKLRGEFFIGFEN